jgi:hypothetical protein
MAAGAHVRGFDAQGRTPGVGASPDFGGGRVQLASIGHVMTV